VNYQHPTHIPSLSSRPNLIFFTSVTDKMTVSFHEPSDENLAPGGENIEKRKFPVRSTPHPSKKLRSIDEASTASPPNCAQGEESRTLFFGGQETVTTPDNIAGNDEEAMGKDKVRQKK
jgi:hypothetical protein